MRDILSAFLKPHSRRSHLKQGGLLTLLLPLFSKKSFAEAGHSTSSKTETCLTAIDIKDDKKSVLIDDSQIMFHINGSSEQRTFGVFIRIPQTDSQYIQKVVLTGARKNTLAVRYFNNATFGETPYLPYLIFDQLRMTEALYFLIILVKSVDGPKVYRFPISPKRSLPSGIFSHPSLKPLRQKLEPLKGTSSTPLRTSIDFLKHETCHPDPKKDIDPKTCFKRNDIDVHFTWKSWGSSDFECQLSLPPSDQHNIRFISLVDPAGRIIALKERDPSSTSSTLVLKPMSSEDARRYRIPSFMKASIDQCPYVTLLWEDKGTVIRERTFWFR